MALLYEKVARRTAKTWTQTIDHLGLCRSRFPDDAQQLPITPEKHPIQ